jgi:cytochrome bd-type quinol oxidase subunit 1
MGVVTGIPMEFQFGTNCEGLSKTAGGVIGQTTSFWRLPQSSQLI